MDTNALKKFTQEARNQLRQEVAARLQQVLIADSVEVHEKAAIVSELNKRIQQTSKDRVIEEAAYTWFNRLCALRYMDLNGFNRIAVVSPATDATQPEILQEAKGGYIDKALPAAKRKQLQGYLSGGIPADNPQQEAYRLLLVASCNQLADAMPFLFERIEDYTELLMPRDLLSESSILYAVREALTADVCQDVEVIGWLYQFYISEKKDEVMARKSAVPSEDIPAVTQLFTPHWIVRYMVENSLGRLWLLNHPQSKLAEKMEYYIDPALTPGEGLGVRDKLPLSLSGRGAGGEGDFLRVSSPEELRLCDPACGSGHILTYAFDLLYAIYEEMGYDPIRIPSLVLEKNLYGIEIDGRAGSLAAFALYMKAFEKDRRFARRGVSPNICVMEDIRFSASDVKAYIDKLGSDLFTQDLWEGLRQFEDATTYGSLIRPKIRNAQLIQQRMDDMGVFEDLFLSKTNEDLKKVLEMVAYLSPRYHVVVANPPYFGGSMGAEYKKFAKDHFPKTKSDTFAMFVERNADLALDGGQLGFMTPFVWMFISSYEKLRTLLIEQKTITSLIQLEYSGFEGATVPICTFTLENKHQPDFKGSYIRLSDFRGAENQAP
ncbi:MAG: BREX-1 system adenine-specific DNA-methyltransferase PglX, partial [Anaerolineaceae bacterium]|nr:BREX-1 system adenine-specific DNA-methyltransferase PglX [Anaerolineaceae bacterium]